MRTRSVDLLAFAWVLLVSFSGCGGGGLPITHYYTLGVPRAVQPSEAARAADGGLIVAVESLAVDPPYDQDRVVYRKSGDSNEVGFYAFHRWASPLGRLAQSALVHGLGGTEGFETVAPMASGNDFSAVLGGRILYIEEVTGPSTQEVRIAVELELRDASDEMLWSGEFSDAENGSFDGGAQAAEAFGRLFGDVVARARRSIEASLAPSVP